jgi:hypothetical protein
MPSQKFGTASNATTPADTVTSGQRCWNAAARMPAGMPAATVSAIAAAVNSSVAGTRSRIRGRGFARNVAE